MSGGEKRTSSLSFFLFASSQFQMDKGHKWDFYHQPLTSDCGLARFVSYNNWSIVWMNFPLSANPFLLNLSTTC